MRERGTRTELPAPLTADELAGVQTDLDKHREWARRNEHRTDERYRLVQKPANDRGIHRALENLKEGK